MNLKTVIYVCLLATFLINLAWGQTAEEIMKRQAEENRKRIEHQMVLSQIMRLGRDKTLQKEIEVVEDQVQGLMQTAQQTQQMMQQFYADTAEQQQAIVKLYQSGDIELAAERNSELTERRNALLEEFDSAVNEVLLPHQIDRLKQIARQQTLKIANPYRDEFGVALALGDELKLSDEERQKLKDAIESARTEYYEKIAELKKEANEKIMEALPPEKQAKLKEIFGEYYDQDKQSRAASDEMRTRNEKQRREMMQRMRESKKAPEDDDN